MSSKFWDGRAGPSEGAEEQRGHRVGLGPPGGCSRGPALPDETQVQELGTERQPWVCGQFGPVFLSVKQEFSVVECRHSLARR